MIVTQIGINFENSLLRIIVSSTKFILIIKLDWYILVNTDISYAGTSMCINFLKKKEKERQEKRQAKEDRKQKEETKNKKTVEEQKEIIEEEKKRRKKRWGSIYTRD